MLDDSLDPTRSYVIVPDLHGEYAVLGYLLDKYSEHNFIFLGDIVDRGPSSYDTFLKVMRTIAAGRGFAVRGNHDKKFYNWLVLWRNAPEILDSDPSYDMAVGFGLRGTINEFASLPEAERIAYGHNFITYYEDIALPYLRLEKNGELHFFAHAAITSAIALGAPREDRDTNRCLYKAVTEPEAVDYVFRLSDDQRTTLHIGHCWTYNEATEIFGANNKSVIMHDIGIGKRDLGYFPDTLPELVIV